jgi:hypothetical protein
MHSTVSQKLKTHGRVVLVKNASVKSLRSFSPLKPLLLVEFLPTRMPWTFFFKENTGLLLVRSAKASSHSEASQAFGPGLWLVPIPELSF